MILVLMRYVGAVVAHKARNYEGQGQSQRGRLGKVTQILTLYVTVYGL